MQILTQKTWSPYASGFVIGLLQIPTVLLLDKTLGVSSAFAVITYHVHSFFSKNDLCATLGDPIWQVGMAVGIFLGAYLSAKLSKTQHPPISSVWQQEYRIRSHSVRYFLSFIGGMFLILGARLANGCTSGNGISGTSQLDASSWIVITAMFASAVLTANLFRLFSSRKEG